MKYDADTIRRFNERLDSLTPEFIEKKNAEELQKAEKDFQALKEALSEGMCSFCGYPLTHFTPKKPCFHWLLWEPRGLKKKHFPILFEVKSFHEIEAYLRWVANTEAPMQNINDLVEEKSCSKVIETTIKYNNLEWSFSCSESDFEGHKNKSQGKEPHYHFQMKKNGFVVINYNEFHIPFNDYDEFSFAVKEGKFEKIKGGHVHGAGMQTYFDNVSPEEILDKMVTADDETKAQFHVGTMVEADEGTTISGDEIEAMIKESKKTGIPVSKLLRNLKNAKVVTYIEPGPGVPELAKRKKRNNNY
jgi:hypothetical protein